MSFDKTRVNLFLEWIKNKINYDYRANTHKNNNIRTVFRGQVYYCDFGVGVGSEYDKVRPCLIIQNDFGNKKSPNTIVAPITSKRCPKAIGVQIKSDYYFNDESGKTRKLKGYVNLGNIITVSKIRLKAKLTKLTVEMEEVDSKIFTSLGQYPKIKYYEEKIEKQKIYIDKLKKELTSDEPIDNI
jgi:mRNA interferase MazF